MGSCQAKCVNVQSSVNKLLALFVGGESFFAFSQLLAAHQLSLAHSCVPPVSAFADTWHFHCVSVSSSGHLLIKTLVILFGSPVCFRTTSSCLVISAMILNLNKLRCQRFKHQSDLETAGVIHSLQYLTKLFRIF